MSTLQRRGLIVVLILTVASSAHAADDTAVVKQAARLLEEISSNPESGIPKQHLREASGIMIIPHIVETELGVGRKRGHGIFLSRDENGEWVHPEPVEVSGVSLGAQAGRKVTDMVIIYSTREEAARYGKNRVSLALTVGAYAGLRSNNRFRGPWFDSKSNKDILVYVRHRGLVVGARLSNERRWGPSFSPADPTTAPEAGPKVAEAKVKARVNLDASASEARGRRMSESPDMARLRAVLTEMTKPAPVRVAQGTKDVKVNPASGARSPAETAGPPP